MVIKKLIISILVMCSISFNALAQNVYSDTSQPGSLLYDDILEVVYQGYTNKQAINFVIAQSITANDDTLTLKTKSGIAFDIPLAEVFYQHMLDEKSLINVTKILIESFPDKIIQIVTLSVVLYPDFAQEVLDGLAITGISITDDIVVAAAQAGADTNIMTSNLDASSVVQNAYLSKPLGTGVGSGGTGAGDATVSSN